MDFSGLTLSRRSIGQATLCTCYEESSVRGERLRVGMAQTWVPRDLTGVNDIGRRDGGNQSSNKEAEECTHFR
jgi:hypothetical protein